MDTRNKRILAVLEVFLVRFIAVPLLVITVYRLFPAFESWQTEKLGFPFPVFIDIVMITLAFLAILAHRRTLSEYAITFRNPKYHLDIAATCFIPFALAGFPMGMGIDHTTWSGAIILAAIQIGLLFLLARLLHRKPTANTGAFLSAGFLFLPLLQSAVPLAARAAAVFFTYAFFVAFGEEIIYRGYMQSRLNEVFGRPYRFFGVPFGWGGILTALLFGLSHTGLVGHALGLGSTITPAWGFWTFFGGLVFGFLREKTGSILAPALLHGLPQAIAAAILLFI